MTASRWGGRRRWIAAASLLVVGALVAGVLVMKSSSDAHPAAVWPETIRPLRPVELFTAPGVPVAASESRWMFADERDGRTRVSIRDAEGRTVGQDFTVDTWKCARTGTGLLGCQSGTRFDIVDLDTGTRTRLPDVESELGVVGDPIGLRDGWLVGAHFSRSAISRTGEVRWRVRTDRYTTWSADESGGAAQRLFSSQDGTARIHDPQTGRVVFGCRCDIRRLPDGFATTPLGENPAVRVRIHAADGRVVTTLPPGARVLEGGDVPLIGEPIDSGPGAPTAGGRYRLRTLDGRTVWEDGEAVRVTKACGPWLIGGDGRPVRSIAGAPFHPPQDRIETVSCGPEPTDSILLTPQPTGTSGRSLPLIAGTPTVVDGRLAGVMRSSDGTATVVYSPGAWAPSTVPVVTALADFVVPLRFTYPRGITSGQSDDAEVRYSPETGRWRIGGYGYGIKISGIRSKQVRIVSDDGVVVRSVRSRSGASGANRSARCGPYTVTADVGAATVVVGRLDGRPVRIGPQPDPAHFRAGGGFCIGYSDDYVALGKPTEPGVMLVPLHPGVGARYLPRATGFVSGRPYALSAAYGSAPIQPLIFAAYPAPS